MATRATTRPAPQVVKLPSGGYYVKWRDPNGKLRESQDVFLTREDAESEALHISRTQNPAKLERCVKKVSRRGGVASPYGVYKAAMKKNAGYSDYGAGYAAAESGQSKKAAADAHLRSVEEARMGRKLMPSEWKILFQRFYEGYRHGSKKNPSDRETFTRAEALARAEAIARTVPGARVRKHAWNITVISKSGKHIVSYLGSKQGFVRANPNPAEAAADAFRDFHGYDSQEVVTIQKRIHYHKHLAAAGEFEGFLVKSIAGRTGRVEIPGAILAFNENRNQLFVEGGDQRLTEAALKKFGIATIHEQETLGKILKVGYFTDKRHLGEHGGKAIYDHTFRATNRAGRHVIVKIARAPYLTYDVPNQQFGISGGSYTIKPEGIDL